MSMNQKVGYARVFSDDQDLEHQRNALNAAGCTVIFEDKVSGKNTNLFEWGNCLNALKSGDKLVIWRLDRLGRSLSDLVATVTLLGERGVSLESLEEKIETANDSGKLVSHVFASLADFERNLIIDRTKAMHATRTRGRLGGRKPKLKPKDVKAIKALLKDPDIPVSDVAKKFGVSRTTIYNHVGVIKPEREGAKT